MFFFAHILFLVSFFNFSYLIFAGLFSIFSAGAKSRKLRKGCEISQHPTNFRKRKKTTKHVFAGIVALHCSILLFYIYIYILKNIYFKKKFIVSEKKNLLSQKKKNYHSKLRNFVVTANFRSAYEFSQEFWLHPYFLFDITFSSDLHFGNFGIVGKLRECRI